MYLITAVCGANISTPFTSLLSSYIHLGSGGKEELFCSVLGVFLREIYLRT